MHLFQWFKARFRSIRYAWQGWMRFFHAEPNTWIHLIATISVFFLAVGFNVSATEWILLLMAIALVWIAEMFNSAIEVIVDWISSEWHEKAQYIKDVSAGAVLVAAAFALITGLVVFIPYFIS